VAFSLEGRLSRELNDRQFVTRASAGDSTYYVLGRVDRREASLTARLDFALTPRMSLEVYAQPLVSAGRYTGLRLVRDPRAAAYADRFEALEPDRLVRPGGEADVSVDLDRNGTADFSFGEPDFRVLSLRTNTVLRWEFLPGSTLFVVWQQNREDRARDSALDYLSGFRDALTATGTNVVAVKVAYWLGM
jgi:hypothetical protein